MQAHRVVFIVLALLLAGCFDKSTIEKLEAEKSQLQAQVIRLQRISMEAQEKIELDYASQMATFHQAEHQAGIASGCRFLINVCPESITAPGDAAIAAGASGGNTAAWWTVYLTKIAAILVALGAALTLWTSKLRPDLSAKRELDLEVEKARADLKETTQRYAEFKRQGAEAELANASAAAAAAAELKGYKHALQEKRSELRELEQAAMEKQTLIDALGSFKL